MFVCNYATLNCITLSNIQYAYTSPLNNFTVDKHDRLPLAYNFLARFTTPFLLPPLHHRFFFSILWFKCFFDAANGASRTRYPLSRPLDADKSFIWCLSDRANPFPFESRPLVQILSASRDASIRAFTFYARPCVQVRYFRMGGLKLFFSFHSWK